MARRHIRRRAAGALLATTTALTLVACSGGGEAPADEPADTASTDAPSTEAGEGQDETPQGGPPEPVELGTLGDVVGYGQGYALFGAATFDSEPVDGITTDNQTLANQSGMVTLDALELENPELYLSDAGLFTSGQKADSSLEASWVVARLDPESGAETWSTDARDRNDADTPGCAYVGSGGELVALGCAPEDEEGSDDLTFLDAESGEERFTVPAEEKTTLNIAAFAPLVVQHSTAGSDVGDDTTYRLTVHDPATGEELASHDDVALCNENGEHVACGTEGDGPRVVSVGDQLVTATGLVEDADVSLVDPTTLDAVWSVGDGDGSISLLGAGSDGVIVKSSETKKAVLLDAATGEEAAAMDIADGTIFDRAAGIYPLGDGTYVADGLASDDTDWMVSLDSLFPDEQE